MNGICALTRQDVFNAARIVTTPWRGWASVCACLLLLSLAACDPPGAPSDRGACWRTAGGSANKPRFALIANDVGSLDDCAVLLESYHLRGAKTANGAFQGYFIFIDDQQMTSSTRLDGFRYPVLQPAQRREIDADLIHLIKERAGKTLAPGDFAIERK